MRPLDQVWWIGGSPCSGKSSIADLLAEQYGLVVYHADQMYDAQQWGVTREKQPHLYKWIHASWNDRWMQPQKQLLEEAIGCYHEQFEMAVRDLIEWSSRERIVAEGCSLLPDRVSELMVERATGIWIVPTEGFQRLRYRARGDWVERVLGQCDDPEAAYKNWMDRDVAFGQWVRERAQELDLEVLEVSGQQTIESNAQTVARHFSLM